MAKPIKSNVFFVAASLSIVIFEWPSPKKKTVPHWPTNNFHGGLTPGDSKNSTVFIGWDDVLAGIWVTPG
jgi:hypothetical protein